MRRGRGGQDMRAPNTGRPAVGKAGRGYRTPDSPAPPRRFALEESPAHVKHGPDRPRGASSPAHAAYTPMMPRTPAPFTPAGAEKAHAAADGSGAYQMTDRRRSGKHARRVLPPRTPPYMLMLPRPPTPFTPASPAAGPTGWRKRAAPPRTAALRSRAAESTRRASSPAHAAYTPMMPRTPTPFTPAGAEKAHGAADGSGAYQIVDRRRSAKHAPRIIPRARRIHADDAAFVPRAAILRPARASGR